MINVAVRLTSTSCDHYLYALKVNGIIDLLFKLDGLNSEFEQGYIDDWDIAFEEDDVDTLPWYNSIRQNLETKREILDKEWRELNG